MSTTESDVRLHPILECAAEFSGALGKVAMTSPVFMTNVEKRTALQALARTEAQLTELRLRVLAAADADNVGADSGARSTAAYVASATRETREAASSDVRLALALDGEFEHTRAAMAAGAVNVAQAKVIVASISKLSDDVAPEERRAAEEFLVDKAQEFDAKELRKLGRRLFEVIDPEKADEEEGKALEREEARARAAAMFSMRDNGDGTHSGTFKLPDLHASILKKALQAITAPRRLGSGRFDPATGKKIPYPTLLGQGLMEFLERLPLETLPRAGGAAATIVVTLDYDPPVRGRCRHPRRRQADLSRPGPPAGVFGGRHPHGARGRVPGARPRSGAAAVHPLPADRARPPVRRLCGGGV